LVDLEQVAHILAVVSLQDLVQILEEDLTCDVVAEVLFLKRPARPVREHRIVHVQDGFVEKRYDGERRELNVFAGVPPSPRLLGRGLDSFPHLMAKTLGVRNVLAVRPQTLADGQYFLETVRQILGASL
jgi:hypothetical protein